MVKRTLESFFSPPTKKTRPDSDVASLRTNHAVAIKAEDVIAASLKRNAGDDEAVTHKDVEPATYTAHSSYPCPIQDLTPSLSEAIQNLLLTAPGTAKAINNQPHLDLLYYQPLIPHPTSAELFDFLRSSLPFYRVCYTINRFGKSTQINTPRFTTVFGLDETSQFHVSTDADAGDASNPLASTTQTTNIDTMETTIVETANPSKIVSSAKYKCTPRPIPPSLALLLNLTEALTSDGTTYNFVLVNYYSTGQDSISYHSDDERFLGPLPNIASFSLGGKRDFLMKHKPPSTTPGSEEKEVDSEPLKLSLGSGDMIIMRGETQSKWLHSIPKRKNPEAEKGRINITLRKAMVPAGTENYYRYNVGDGCVYRWDAKKKEMVAVEKS